LRRDDRFGLAKDDWVEIVDDVLVLQTELSICSRLS
jgi:hypothetical protein